MSAQKLATEPSAARSASRAVKPVIGYLKEGHRMGRNYLTDRAGDATNVVLAAVEYNFRLLLAWLAVLWCAPVLMVPIDDQALAPAAYAA